MSTTTERWTLEDYLSEEQKATWKKNRQIIVVAPNGHVYMLSDGQRVYLLRDGTAVTVYNVWALADAEGNYAPQDVSLLTQLLWLQADPDWFVAQGCNDNFYSPGRINDGVPEMTGYFVKGFKDAKKLTESIDEEREDYE